MNTITLEGTQLIEVADFVRELLAAGEAHVTVDIRDDGSATAYSNDRLIPVGWELPGEEEA